MRRRVLLVVVFLLAGAVVNVAVAWGCARFVRVLSSSDAVTLTTAINTLFYAAILWLLILGPFALRRLIRQRRGVCPACGYDLRHGEHKACPECGWPEVP